MLIKNDLMQKCGFNENMFNTCVKVIFQNIFLIELNSVYLYIEPNQMLPKINYIIHSN